MAKRRRKAAGLGILLAILLLGWHGLGLLDGNPDAEGDGEGQRPPDAPSAGARGGPSVRGASEVGAGDDAGAATSAGPQSAAPVGDGAAEGTSGVAPPQALLAATGGVGSGEAGAATSTAPSPDGPPPDSASPDAASSAAGTADGSGATGEIDPGRSATEPFVADRAQGLLQVMVASGERLLLGDGYRAADALARMELPAPWRERLDGQRSMLDGRLEAQLGKAGDALLAADGARALSVLRPLWASPHLRIEQALRQWSSAHAWPALVRQAATPGDQADDPVQPPLSPLPTQRAVQWFRSGSEPLLAQVVSSAGDRVTLRVASGGGVTFPSARRVDVVPIDPSPVEQLEQGLVSLAAGDLAAARVWAVVATQAGADGVALAELVRAVGWQ